LGFHSWTLLMKTDNIQSKNVSSPASDENSSRFLSLGLIPNYWLWEVDAHGIYTYCSPTVFEILGYFPEEILGKTPFDIMVPEEKDKLMAIFGQIVNNREPVIRFESSSIHKDGSVIYIETNGVPYYNSSGDLIGYRGINQDITRLKAAEKALRESESRLEHTLDMAKLGIWEFDSVRDGFILDDRFYSLFGTSVKEQGTFIPSEDFRKKYIHPDDQKATSDMVRKAEKSGTTNLSIEHRIIRFDGEVRYFLACFVFRKDEKGNTVMNYGVNQDITTIIKAELELRELNAEKDKFFSILAHDLRGPLSSFVGATEMLFEDILTMEKVEVKAIIESMKKSASNIYSLLENLLEWSRLVRNRMDFTPEKFNLKNKIEACTGILSENASKKRIEMEINIPDDIEVTADKHMFDGIIRNLVSNAIKFTPVGGKVSVTADYKSDHSIEVKIHDSGIGMTPELKNKLFLLSGKTNRPGTEGEPSSGLGLLLCKEFIEKHGGELWVESEVGKGSTFSFVIPQSFYLHM
jgi:PAS domain S-box-containing protein